MGQVYDEYAKTVYKYLIYLTKSTELAEELTQETFYRAVKNANKFKGDSKVSTWLCQIAKHTWYQYIEKRKKKQTVAIDDTVQAPQNVEKEFFAQENQVLLFKQMQALSPLNREVLYLRLMGDLSFQEIGVILNKSEN